MGQASCSRVPTAYWLALQVRGAHPRMAAPLTVCEGNFNAVLATGFDSAQPHDLTGQKNVDTLLLPISLFHDKNGGR
jgi:hypothetical protein